ncbi:hypothetical protein FSP39_014152 [Pinctada imbricata]|uniref:G-protein coupled receptors family 1 profile domain-containing protein n=1 Tax=Pinctada imbricata TaxID=66713 RepID=A0AA89BX38_PINIB|nr:hypothetical protein FSP39_014152 [Pinctada imbricata]
MLNFTSTIEPDYCDENERGNHTSEIDGQNIYVLVTYVFISACGFTGNGLVIYVILRYAKMKTVTNMYILNLAVSDFMFLIDLPLVSVTSWLKYWVFGEAMCKINFILYSITIFTSVFTLMTLSIDRYMAVCHPLTSQNYRQPIRALFVIMVIWTVSFLVMLPTILYSQTIPNHRFPGKRSCTIKWPENSPIQNDKAYTWYTFLLGFAIPISLITVFYTLVVIRLRNVGPANRQRSAERKKSHKKVTRMVLAVISVYVICWLPHWVFQINLTFRTSPMPPGMILLYNIISSFSYANSMLNPILYAFLSENFRKSFKQAFICCIPSNNNDNLLSGVQHGHGNGGIGGKMNDLRSKETLELHSVGQKTSNTMILNNGRPELISTIDEAETLIHPPGKLEPEKKKFEADGMSLSTTVFNNDDEDHLIVYADKQIQTK